MVAVALATYLATSATAAPAVVMAATVASFNLPAEGVAFILGVDTFMDMARTSVNLIGNCLAAAVVARWEGVDLRASRRSGDGPGHELRGRLIEWRIPRLATPTR